VLGLHRFSLAQQHLQGLLLGFAAFDAQEIRRGIATLAAALATQRSIHKGSKGTLRARK